jgi:hypothetical protein
MLTVEKTADYVKRWVAAFESKDLDRAHRNFKRPRSLPANAGPQGLELAELAPGLLLWPGSTGTRRFAWSSFCLDIRFGPGSVDIEPTCGAAPPWLPLAAQPGARFL